MCDVSMHDDEIAKILLNLKAVKLRTNPPFKWASGILAPVYTDNRILMSYPKERDIIIDKFAEIIKQNNLEVDVIGGIATSGIPFAAWLAKKLDLPMIYIRKKTKEYGKENLIEGVLKEGKKVILIEDLISTGSSSINGVKAIRESGGIIENCLAVFSYELEESQKTFKENNISLFNLTDLTTLINIALQRKYITKKQEEMIIEWRRELTDRSEKI